MGYYIQGPSRGKAQYMIENHGAKRISADEAKQLAGDTDNDLAPVCVVDNGFFDAAGFAFSSEEFEAFNHEDGRPKQWLSMPRLVTKLLSGYVDE